jgi:hypothetical protein
VTRCGRHSGLLYPLRPINGVLVVREPSHYESAAPLQTAHTAALQRLIAANPIEVLPLSFELQQAHGRLFGNACLYPDFSRALPPKLSEGPDDALVMRFVAPVIAGIREHCPGLTSPKPLR